MARDNLGNKQTIIIHNCLISDDKFDLVIAPQRPSVGYIKTKRQRFSKQRHSVSESETTAIQALHNLKDSKTKTTKLTTNYISLIQKPRHKHQ